MATTKWAVGRGAQASGTAVARQEEGGILVGHSWRREIHESVHGRDGEVFDI